MPYYRSGSLFPNFPAFILFSVSCRSLQTFYLLDCRLLSVYTSICVLGPQVDNFSKIKDLLVWHISRNSSRILPEFEREMSHPVTWLSPRKICFCYINIWKDRTQIIDARERNCCDNLHNVNATPNFVADKCLALLRTCATPQLPQKHLER